MAIIPDCPKPLIPWGETVIQHTVILKKCFVCAIVGQSKGLCSKSSPTILQMLDRYMGGEEVVLSRGFAGSIRVSFVGLINI